MSNKGLKLSTMVSMFNLHGCKENVLSIDNVEHTLVTRYGEDIYRYYESLDNMETWLFVGAKMLVDGRLERI